MAFFEYYYRREGGRTLAKCYNPFGKMVRAKDYLIRGRVQGVGYRYFAQEAAERYGIRGFARNLANGDVEVHAEGDATALQLLKEELQRGPRMAHVTQLIETDATVSGTWSSFLIRG